MFFENFYIYFRERYWPVIVLSCNIFICDIRVKQIIQEVLLLFCIFYYVRIGINYASITWWNSPMKPTRTDFLLNKFINYSWVCLFVFSKRYRPFRLSFSSSELWWFVSKGLFHSFLIIIVVRPNISLLSF